MLSALHTSIWCISIAMKLCCPKWCWFYCVGTPKPRVGRPDPGTGPLTSKHHWGLNPCHQERELQIRHPSKHCPSLMLLYFSFHVGTWQSTESSKIYRILPSLTEDKSQPILNSPVVQKMSNSRHSECHSICLADIFCISLDVCCFGSSIQKTKQTPF